jgi:hypothetical protein
MMPEFDHQWKRLGLGDEDLRQLQQELLENPKAGAVLRGTGGLRIYRIMPFRVVVRAAVVGWHMLISPCMRQST